ncbi:Polyketide synthase module [Pyrenophora tritici-repentis]|nr:Polyketide synthase [Pyrenophora tritici-repentis]KAI1524537.1 Polyketide synthase module [Pyrenophora tritici-repentis]KAI1524866.1 Polyketide synthase module [Pyrenophora tritici-repentis]KAI1560898.1 Polyketide synthase module [Pyrenophora tritici-repentis]KAI1594474.1 Polyketide synthase module [Pyrenophora tritici-repentis]
MDPQQKLLLENVYHALENAGLSAKDVATSRTSVFVGSSNNDHLAFANEDLEMCYKNKATGTSPSILANRISWFYDLRGTSQTIDTACSSSLVAFHQGCLSVRSKDSDMSIISGVNVIEHPAAFLQLTNLGVLSPDGQCFSFDHRANGYGRGEGVSTLIVKPLSSAIQDGNVIRAIVRATGTSHDGKTPGITLPSQTAQAALIRSVYASAHLDMDQTAYVEAHGTGTQVGDPLEIEGIVSAFETRARQRPLYIGSIKAGLGHLEGGAGLAGLVKAVLMLEQQAIPPAVNLEKVNPNIPTDANIQFAKHQIPWPCTGVRRVSINSFGFGGTNAHVVLDDADNYRNSSTRTRNDDILESEDTIPSIIESKETEDGGKPLVFVLSASDEQDLRKASEKLATHIRSVIGSENIRSETQYLKDLAFTLSEKRSALRWRSSFVASSLTELSSRLTAKSHSAFRSALKEERIAFVFTGQGAQWLGMGSSLMIYPGFRKSIEDASSYMKRLGSPWVLKGKLYL